MAGEGDQTISTSRRCAFCGAYLCKTCAAVVAYSSSSTNTSKIKPLRWRFLSGKGSRSKLMCTVCAERRQVPVPQHENCSDPTHRAVSRSVDHDVRATPMELEALQKPRRHTVEVEQQLETATKPETPSTKPKPVHEPAIVPRRSAVKSYSNHRLPRESLGSWHRPSSTIEIGSRQSTQSNDTRTSGRQRAQTDERLSSTADLLGMSKSLDLPQHYFEDSRVSTTSTITSELGVQPVGEPLTPTQEENPIDIRSRPSTPLDNDQKRSNNRPRRARTDDRVSSTADILGISRVLELPSDYFHVSTRSPTFTAMDAPQGKSLDLKELETPKPQETEEERQRRQTVDYTQMLTRMRRHYEAVQINGTSAHPVAVPPRRMRARRAKSAASHRTSKDDPMASDVSKSEAKATVDPAEIKLVREGLVRPAGPVRSKSRLTKADLFVVEEKLVKVQEAIKKTPVRQAPVRHDPVNWKPGFTVDLAYLSAYKDDR